MTLKDVWVGAEQEELVVTVLDCVLIDTDDEVTME